MRRIALILALSLVPFAVCGEEADWSLLSTPVFTNLGVDQGLPHPSGMSVAQDSAGFIWVGTQGGLSRYDGYRFITFQHRDDDPGSMPTNFIDDLVAGNDGRMWVGDFAGNILRYEPTTDSFSTFPEPKEFPARNFVESVIADGKGGVWVGTAVGLEHIDGDSGTITHVSQPAGEPQADYHVRALVRRRDGSVWMATDQGLWRQRAGLRSFDRIVLPSDMIKDSPLLALSEDDEGRLWFGTTASEIGRIDADGSGHKVAQLPTTTAHRMLLMAMTQAGPDELWIGVFGSGVFVLDKNSGRLRTIRDDPGVAVALPYEAGRGMMTDRAGRVWITTFSGVSYASPRRSKVLDSVFPSSRESGISTVDILSLAEAPGGKIWLGLSDQGVGAVDSARGHISLLPPVTQSPLSRVPGLTVDANGDLWVGTSGTPGLYRLDGKSGRLVDSGWRPESGALYRRLLARAGYVWVAAGPLVRFDPRDGQVRVYHHSDPISLFADGAFLLMPAADDRLWVGTGKGLELFDPKSETFRHFLHDSADPNSPPGGLITAMATDRRGRLWIGTLGNGIGVGTPDDTGGLHFQRLSMRDGLPNDNVTGLLDDTMGRVWASTANGLAVIDTDTLAVQPLDRADGLAIAAYAVGSSLRLRDGTLLFGGRGLTVVHPERFDRPAFDPPVVVTGLRVNGVARPVGDANLSLGSPLILGAHERKVEVEFAALDFSASETLRYSYRLTGFDEDWMSVDASRRVAAYTNLPPGQYTLQMRGGDRTGAWSHILSLPLVVLPAWWQTWWFRSLAALAVLVLLVLLIRARTAILRRRAQVLERLVARQTRDLTESNARLAESNARLAELAAHDPLTELLNRRAFVDLAERELERASRYQRPTSLLMVDVDHFKLVNDTHGHGAGDDVLHTLAAQIRELLRSSDLCARMGGEELAVLMPETQPEAALKVAALLREAVAEKEHQAAAVGFRVTVSVGVATRRQNEGLTELLERADQALYAAKTGGRNRVVMAGEALIQ